MSVSIPNNIKTKLKKQILSNDNICDKVVTLSDSVSDRELSPFGIANTIGNKLPLPRSALVRLAVILKVDDHSIVCSCECQRQ